MRPVPAPEPFPKSLVPAHLPETVVYVEAAVSAPVRRAFTYSVPEGLRGKVAVGARALLPFGKRKVPGFVLGPVTAPPPGVAIKPLYGMLDAQSVFDAELLSFLLEAARYYLHPLGEVLRMAAPALSREAVAALRQSGAMAESERLRGAQLGARTMRFVLPASAPPAGGRLGKVQKLVLSLVQVRGEISIEELARHVRDPRSTVRALVTKGLVRTEDREVASDPFFETPVARRSGPAPNPGQAAAIAAILQQSESDGAAFLVHGVTGSGKTEVYLQVIAAALQRDRGALVLVPEIALTPQLVHRFRERFGDAIAVMHSELPDRALDDAFRGLRSGRLRVAIGARSALFAPVQRLGVIVVDEEHDASFKQEEGFRYHARDMALLRAHRAQALCVLGSATPSLESMYLAQRGKLTRLCLPARATAQRLPEVTLVDLQRHRSGPSGHRLLSGPLHRALSECLDAQGQAILFLNRRGFAPALRCEACGELQQCQACTVALTFHRGPGLLRCHYCDAMRPAGTGCSACGHRPLEELGVGTEQLQDVLQAAFPRARVARLDRDTASGRGIERVLDRLRRGEVDVLVGTQMVTKGHDLPGVTLVGVILADQSLAFPDFRAPERTFQLLSQVAGRAGRGERSGRVLLQTYQPEHPILGWAQHHDFEAFFEAEMRERRRYGFPPFSRLVAVRVDALDEARAKAAVQRLADCARRCTAVTTGRVDVLGPAPAPIIRIRSRFRYRFLLRSTERRLLRAVAERIAERIDLGLGAVRAVVDVDPINML